MNNKFDNSKAGQLLVTCSGPNNSAGPLCEIRYFSNKKYYIKIIDDYGIKGSNITSGDNPFVMERNVLAVGIATDQYDELKKISEKVEKAYYKILEKKQAELKDIEKKYAPQIFEEREILRRKIAAILKT